MIELMAAMTVGTMVLLVAASLLGRVGTDYGRVSGGVGAEREARAALGQLTADAATAWHHPEAVFEEKDDPWPRDRIAFLSLQSPAAQSEDGRSGDLCAVNYYVKDVDFGDGPVRCLMRGFRESVETFAALREETVGELFGEAPRDEPVAFGIVGFEAQPLVRGVTGEWEEWQAPEAPGEGAEEPEEVPPPEALRVRLVVVRRELLARLETAADWDGPGTGGKMIGTAEDAEKNKSLQVFESVVRLGQP